MPYLATIFFSYRYQWILHFTPNILLMIRLATYILNRQWTLDVADDETSYALLIFDPSFICLNVLFISLLCVTNFVS